MLPLTKKKNQRESIGLMDVLWIATGILKAELSPGDVEVSQ